MLRSRCGEAKDPKVLSTERLKIFMHLDTCARMRGRHRAMVVPHIGDVSNEVQISRLLSPATQAEYTRSNLVYPRCGPRPWVVHTFYLPLFPPPSSTYKTTAVVTSNPPATLEPGQGPLLPKHQKEPEKGKETTLRRSQDRSRQGPLVPKCAKARPAHRKDLHPPNRGPGRMAETPGHLDREARAERRHRTPCRQPHRLCPMAHVPALGH